MVINSNIINILLYSDRLFRKQKQNSMRISFFAICNAKLFQILLQSARRSEAHKQRIDELATGNRRNPSYKKIEENS